MALLADVYLWDQQYQKSIDYCDSLINTGMFGLEDFNTWFRLYNPGNSMKESLFEIQFDDGYESQENPMYNELVTTGGSVLLTLTQNVTRLFDQNDLRFCFPSSPIWKYRGIDWGVPVPRASSQRDANFIYYRYADILMMKAEALTELNSNLTEANSLVRQIIERAGLTYTEVATREELRKVILDERGREFIVEGKRWFDLLRAAKRNNFANKQLIIDIILAGADVKKQAILKTKVYDTMSYYLPIPEHELLYNQNLKQNPFYDR